MKTILLSLIVLLAACHKDTATAPKPFTPPVNIDSAISVNWTYHKTSTFSYYAWASFPDAYNPPSETYVVWVRRNGTVSNPAKWIPLPTSNFYYAGDSVWFVWYAGNQYGVVYKPCPSNTPPNYLDLKVQITQ